MPVQIGDLLKAFPDLLQLNRGQEKALIEKMQDPDEATQDGIIFVGTPAILKAAVSSASTNWVIDPRYLNEIPESVTNVLTSPNVPLVMARMGKRFFPQVDHIQPVGDQSIHPSAIIDSTATIGEKCTIGPGAVIGRQVSLAAGAMIGANAVIEPNVKIGPRTHIHPLVFIGHGCEIGADCEVLPNSTIGSEGFGYAQDKDFNHTRLNHYGRVILEDCVHIGAGVQIDRGTLADSRIGYGTKVDNHCHFGHNIQIGRNTLITGGMIAAGSVTIGSYCVFGGRTTIKGHLSICDRAHFGGLSAISKSVTEPGEYAGFPLQDVKSDLRVRSTIKNLPEMAKQLRRVLHHLGLESKSK